MLAPGPQPGAHRHAQDHWNGGLATEHVTHLGGLIEDLVEAIGNEACPHDVDHGPKAGHSCPDGRAHEAGLGDRGVADPLGTELLDQALRDAERSAHGALQRRSESGPAGDVLTEDDDAGIGSHGLGKRFVNGLDE